MDKVVICNYLNGGGLIEFIGQEFGTKNNYGFVSTLGEFTVQQIRR